MTRRKDAELAYSQIAALEQRAKDAAARRTALEESLATLAARSEACRTEIAAIRKAKTDSQTTITQKERAIREATEKRLACQQKETEALAKARTASDSREEMGREMARLAERKAAAETEYDQTVAKLWDEYQLSVSQAEQLCVEFDSLPALRAQVADLRGKIRALGSVNVSAIEEYKEVKARYDELSRQVTDVEESRNELSRMIAKLSAQMREIFTDSFRAINENFSRVFTELFGGGEASLVLEDESDVLACGIGIRVAPPGKVIKNLEAFRRRAGAGGYQHLLCHSGGEPRALLYSGRDRSRLGRCQRGAVCPVSAPHQRQDPVHRHHPPPRHHGGCQRAVWRYHAGGRRVQAAQAGSGTG